MINSYSLIDYKLLLFKNNLTAIRLKLLEFILTNKFFIKLRFNLSFLHKIIVGTNITVFKAITKYIILNDTIRAVKGKKLT